MDIGLSVTDWLSYWSPEMPGALITAVFSNDFNYEFSGTQEFIDWARDYFESQS